MSKNDKVVVSKEEPLDTTIVEDEVAPLHERVSPEKLAEMQAFFGFFREFIKENK